MTMSCYYIITNATETCDQFVYQTGLNILTHTLIEENSFNNDMYFTTANHIHKCYHMGIYIREVILPIWEPNFRLKVNAIGSKWQANMIILGERYSLFEPKTYEKLGLDMRHNTHLLDHASAHGLVFYLDWCIQNSLYEYSINAFDRAAVNGHLNVIEWWIQQAKNKQLRLKYSHLAMDGASANGHIHILEYIKNIGIKRKYTIDALDIAAANGHDHVIYWWLTSGIPTICNQAHHLAAVNGHLSTLQLLCSFDLRPVFYTNTLDLVSSGGHINILCWWLENKLDLVYSEKSIDMASIEGHISVLNWWKELHKTYGIEFKYTGRALDGALARNRLDVAKWWRTSGFQMKTLSSFYETI
jgi:hypothetical protein